MPHPSCASHFNLDSGSCGPPPKPLTAVPRILGHHGARYGHGHGQAICPYRGQGEVTRAAHVAVKWRNGDSDIPVGYSLRRWSQLQPMDHWIILRIADCVLKSERRTLDALEYQHIRTIPDADAEGQARSCGTVRSKETPQASTAWLADMTPFSSTPAVVVGIGTGKREGKGGRESDYPADQLSTTCLVRSGSGPRKSAGLNHHRRLLQKSRDVLVGPADGSAADGNAAVTVTGTRTGIKFREHTRCAPVGVRPSHDADRRSHSRRRTSCYCGRQIAAECLWIALYGQPESQSGIGQRGKCKRAERRGGRSGGFLGARCLSARLPRTTL